jgi:hypothetical protein
MVGRQNERRGATEPHTNEETEDAREPASPLRLLVRGEHQPLELSLTQGIVEPLAYRSLDLAGVRVQSADAHGMKPDVDLKTRRLAPIDLGFHAGIIADQHRLLLGFSWGTGCPPVRTMRTREQETGSNHAVFGRIAAIA